MVAINVWPTDALDGAVNSEARWRSMARLWYRSGIAYGTAATRSAVSLAAGTLTLQAGAAWVDGAYLENLSVQTFAAGTDGLLVYRFTPASNLGEVVYRTGASLTPTQTTAVWEVPICRVVAGALVDLRRYVGPEAQISVPQIYTPSIKLGGTTHASPQAAVGYVMRDDRGWVDAIGFIRWGASISGSGSLLIGMPVSISMLPGQSFDYVHPIGMVAALNTGGVGRLGFAKPNSTLGDFYVSDTTAPSSGAVGQANPSWTNAFPYAAWAAGDEIHFTLRYFLAQSAGFNV